MRAGHRSSIDVRAWLGFSPVQLRDAEEVRVDGIEEHVPKE